MINVNSEKWPFTCQGLQVYWTGHSRANLGRWTTTFFKNRKVAVHQPRLAGWWPEAHTIRKVAADQPRLAGWGTDHSPATVCRFDPWKKVRFNLPTLAGLWPLFKPATYGRCSQVPGLRETINPNSLIKNKPNALSKWPIFAFYVLGQDIEPTPHRPYARKFKDHFQC